MKTENIFCLVKTEDFSALNLVNMTDAPKGTLINVALETWHDSERFRKIGESGDGNVQLVFDWTNFKHFQKALEVTANFHR